MRDFRFRAWDKKIGKWTDITAASVHGEDKVGYPVSTVVVYNGESECEIMQYTGLKDKNGVEIYEGDIVTYGKDSPEEIIFQDGGFAFSSRWQLANFFPENTDKVEVIGNCFENPELLEVNHDS